MNITGLLNADVQTVWKLLQRGFFWWCGELLVMVPERWRVRAKPKTVIYLHEGGFLAVTADGSDPRPLESFASGEIRDAVLCLPRTDGLSRVLDLPPLPPSDLRQMIELDIDRLTPFEKKDVFFDVAVKERGGDRQSVAIGVIPKTRALAALDKIGEMGIVPAALSLSDEEGRPCYDFLPSIRMENSARTGWAPARIWGAAMLLLILDVLVFVLHDDMSLKDLQQRVAVQRPMVQTVEKLRATVQAESRRRKELMQRRETTSPLPILDTLTRSLPDQSWIQHLEWDGVTLRVVGWSRDDVDVPALIEASPFFTSVRPLSPTEAAKQQWKPFELTTELKKGNDK